jgi:chitinase
VILATPFSYSTVSGIVSVTANASDNVGVSKIEYYLNDVLQAVDTSAPYVFSWNTQQVKNGSYMLTARAYDAAGNVSNSAGVPVTVSNAKGNNGKNK